MIRQQKTLLIIIIILGAALRISYFFINDYNMDIYDDEPWSRINIATQWALNTGSGLETAFGPLYTYIISAFWIINREYYILLSRLASIIFGIAFLLLYFKLLKEEFGLRAAYWGTFLLGIYPLHIHLSSVTLPEIPSLFFLFSSLYLIYGFIRKNKIYYLVLSSAALTISSMLRFESWLFILLFSLILYIKLKNFRYTFIFLFLSCIFPCILMIYNYKLTGNPFTFITVARGNTLIEMQGVSLLRRVSGFVWALSKTLSLPIFVLSAAGFIWSVVKRKARINIFMVSFLAVLLINTVMTIQGGYNYMRLRYSLLLGLLLIPYGGIMLEEISNRVRQNFLVLFLIISLSLFYSIKTLGVFRLASTIPDSMLAMISWIKSNINDGDKVLLESGEYHPFIVLNSGLDFKRQLTQYNHPELHRSRDIDKYMKDTDYIIIHKTRGIFREVILNTSSADRMSSVFENEDWRVLKKRD